MNITVKRLAQIESASAAVTAGIPAAKKQLAAEYEKKIQQFDSSLADETSREFDSLRETMRAAMQSAQAAQEDHARQSAALLEKHYQANHETYVDRLFCSMTEE